MAAVLPVIQLVLSCWLPASDPVGAVLLAVLPVIQLVLSCWLPASDPVGAVLLAACQ
jgi:hypothetical protein